MDQMKDQITLSEIERIAIDKGHYSLVTLFLSFPDTVII